MASKSPTHVALFSQLTAQSVSNTFVVASESSSSAKASGFTRSHSLETPDAHTDEDIPMDNWDKENQDTSDFLDDCISEELWTEMTGTRDDASQSTRAQDAATESRKTLATSPVKPTRRKRISANQKIESLRAELNDLTTQLQALETALPQQGQVAKPQRSQLWKKIATRQLEQREKSEEENVKLRQMMDMQVQEARNLKRVLQRRSKIEVGTSKTFA